MLVMFKINLKIYNNLNILINKNFKIRMKSYGKLKINNNNNF